MQQWLRSQLKDAVKFNTYKILQQSTLSAFHSSVGEIRDCLSLGEAGLACATGRNQ